MPPSIQDLIPQDQKTVSAYKDETIHEVLEKMAMYDFSQLPVVDEQNKLQGIVTKDSILTAIISCGTTTPGKIKVSHAMERAKTCRKEDELPSLLDALQNTTAVIITEQDDSLAGIITDYDTSKYFHQRAADIMLAEDIEQYIKEYITSVCEEDDSLKQAVQDIQTSGKNLKNDFKKSLKSFLGQTGGKPSTIDEAQDAFENAFKCGLAKPEKDKDFEQLTLSEYIQIFKNQWDKLKANFKDLELSALTNVLEQVRETRNAIAHFREVTSLQRQQMRYCLNLLELHQQDITANIPSIELPPVTDVTCVTGTGDFEVAARLEPVAEPIPVLAEPSTDQPNFNPGVEEDDPKDSRYAPLAHALQRQIDKEKVALSFREIERFIGGELPPSARQHRNWWANDSVSHSHSQAWLEVGWRVSSVNMGQERVVFSRMADRERDYINFFNDLLAQLKTRDSISVEPAMNLQGRSWYCCKVTGVQETRPLWPAVSFARRSRLRVELYMQSQHPEDKPLFDALYQRKDEIEAKFGAPLSWERLEGKYGSRIAVYRPNSSITASEEDLKAMQAWAAETLERFYRAIVR